MPYKSSGASYNCVSMYTTFRYVHPVSWLFTSLLHANSTLHYSDDTTDSWKNSTYSVVPNLLTMSDHGPIQQLFKKLNPEYSLGRTECITKWALNNFSWSQLK